MKTLKQLLSAWRAAGLFILALFVLSGCASGGSGTADADRLVTSGDHISMQAQQTTPAQQTTSEVVLRQDAQILEDRLVTFAGEGNYRIEVKESEEGPGRIEIYLDPKVKGDRRLSQIAPIYFSGNLRYSLFSVKDGFLRPKEGSYLNISPADLTLVEITDDYPDELDSAKWGEKTKGIKISFSDEFISKHRETLSSWSSGIGLIADIEDKTDSNRDDYGALCNNHLLETEDPRTFYIVNTALTEEEINLLSQSLQAEPLAGSYEVALLSYIDWDSEDLSAQLEEAKEENSLLCTRQELLERGEETVIFTLPQYDRNMDTAARTDLISALLARMDALGMPYCIGEVSGQKGTLAVQTLPQHINPEVLTILRNSSPLNLTANVYLLPLEGGLYEARVVPLQGGNLGLDLLLSSGRKDSLQKMTAAQESIGGGDTAICLQKKLPICGALTANEIADGHLLLDQNYTGIGGSTWNEENRWILDLLCAVINHKGYPSEGEKGFIAKYFIDLVFRDGDYAAVDRDGRIYKPSAAGFHDDLLEQEELKKIQKSFPGAWFGEKSEFDSEFGISNLHLGLTQSDPDLSAKLSEGLSSVQNMILTGPIVNVTLYPVEELDLTYSLFKYFGDEQLKINEGTYVTEEFSNLSISKNYRNDPSQILLMGEIVRTLSKMEDLLRQ